jgi:AraC family transcriptional regulator of adaptative response/methylated-DNA-[protein]-cysteine methyltransferase
MKSSPRTRRAPGAAADVADAARDPRWRAVLARDARADGTFVYSVRTTGVFCRPSCGARRPRPENVAFHADPAAARRAGFRPCQRCTPEAPSPAVRDADRIAAACRFLDDADGVVSLRDLAARIGVSPFHLHRLFKARTGLTPRTYAAAARAERARTSLAEGATVTAAIHGAGFGSSGRFYAQADAALGMTPTAFRRGGERATLRVATRACSLGAVLVAATGRGVAAILLGDDAAALARDLERRFPRARIVAGDAEFAALVARVVALVDCPAQKVDLPLDLRGTAFQRRVWAALRRVPAGSTTTYTELARAIGALRAVRAVAQACAANPLAVAVPCHRVVRKDGGLSGYRWGPGRKRTLLAREADGRA